MSELVDFPSRGPNFSDLVGAGLVSKNVLDATALMKMRQLGEDCELIARTFAYDGLHPPDEEEKRNDWLVYGRDAKLICRLPDDGTGLPLLDDEARKAMWKELGHKWER